MYIIYVHHLLTGRYLPGGRGTCPGLLVTEFRGIALNDELRSVLMCYGHSISSFSITLPTNTTSLLSLIAIMRSMAE